MNYFKKRLLSAVLGASLVFSNAQPLFAVAGDDDGAGAYTNDANDESAAFSADDSEEVKVEARVYRPGLFSDISAPDPECDGVNNYEYVNDPKYKQLYAYLYTELKKRRTEIPVSDFQVSVDMVLSVWKDIYVDQPELLSLDGYATAIGITYPQTGIEYAKSLKASYNSLYTSKDVEAFEKRMNGMRSALENDWSDVEKLLYLHDDLVTHCNYDGTYERTSIFDTLITGSAVCEGYADTYQMLLRKTGIEEKRIMSGELNHIWNLVKLNGEWYHIDTTWDDAGDFNSGTYIVNSDCYHNNFLCSNDAIKASGHDTYDWALPDTQEAAGDLASGNAYDSYFWRDVKCALPRIGHKTFYIIGDKGYIYDFSTGKAQEYDVATGSKDSWLGETVWEEEDNVVSLADKFYYFTPDTIYSIDTDGRQETVYTTTDEEKKQGFIWMLETNGNKLSYYIRGGKNSDVNYHKDLEIKDVPVMTATLEFAGADICVSDPDTQTDTQISAKAYDYQHNEISSAVIRYESADESVVKVGQDGRLTICGYGITELKAICDNKVTYCRVVVGGKGGSSADDEGFIPGDGGATDMQPQIDSSTSFLTLVKGQKFMMGKGEWKSSDKKYISVKKNQVKANKEGHAVLTNGTQIIDVFVTDPVFPEKKLKLVAGQDRDISLQNTCGLNVYYVSSDPDIATVNQYGFVSGIGKGTVQITAYINGVAKKCRVMVSDTDTSKRDFTQPVNLMPMQSVNIKLKGFNAKKASWSSDTQLPDSELPAGCVFADKVVSINKNGKVTAIGSGYTVLTAKGGSTADVTFEINVQDPVPLDIHMRAGSTKAIKLYGIKDKLDWTEDVPGIVSVDKNKNKINALATGETMLSAEYKGFTYVATVHVEDPSLRLENGLNGKDNKYNITLKKGDEVIIRAEKMYQPLVFISNHDNIAYASTTGVLSARTEGTAKLTAKAYGKKITITVTVTP